MDIIGPSRGVTASLDADERLDSLEILDQNGARIKLNFFDREEQTMPDKEQVAFDERGFMRDPSQWNVDVGEAVAESLGLEDLGYPRVQVIEYMRQHYLARGSVLPAEEVCRAVGLEYDGIRELFGNYEKAWKTAGLPDPGIQLREFMEDAG